MKKLHANIIMLSDKSLEVTNDFGQIISVNSNSSQYAYLLAELNAKEIDSLYSGIEIKTLVNPLLFMPEIQEIEIGKLNKGDFFKLDPLSKVVYVRDCYIQQSGKYSARKFEDHNQIIYKKKDCPVYVGFTF